MFAYDYPMLAVFVSMLSFFLFVIWIILLFKVIADVFRDPKQSGGGKAMWLLVLVVLPYIGVIAYIVAHGEEMSLRSLEFDRAKAAQLRY